MSHLIKYIDRSGKSCTARLAGDLSAIRAVYARDGKVITCVQVDYLSFLRRHKMEELIATLKGIGGFLQVGDPMSKAFDLSIDSLPANSLLAPIFLDIKKGVERGKSLHASMEPHQAIFGNMVMALTMAGENSGKLGAAFLGSAKHLAKMGEVKSGIFKKLWYPMGTIFGALSLLEMVSRFVIPMMSSASGQAHPSVYVQMVMVIGQIVPWAILLVIAVVVGVCIWFTQQQEEAERFLFRLGGLREIVFFRTFHIAYTTMATLVGVGVPLYDALGIAARTSSLVMFRSELEASQILLRKTGKFASALKSLPPFRRSMLENALNEQGLTTEFESTSDYYYKQYIAKIESIAPKAMFLSIVIVCVVLFVVVMATVVPHFESAGNIGNMR